MLDVGGETALVPALMCITSVLVWLSDIPSWKKYSKKWNAI
jgi:hypothetical protein